MDIEKILLDHNVILKGHFLLSSGLHSDTYFEKFRLLENPSLLTELILMVKDKLEKLDFNIVIGPLTGGALIAFAVAQLFSRKAFYAEKDNDTFVLRRGFKLSKSHRVLVVDDVLTTGGSIFRTINLLQGSGAKLEGVFVLIDRSLNTPNFGVPLISVYQKRVKVYTPDECPLCRIGIPLERRGSK